MPYRLTKGMFADPACNTFGLKYGQIKNNEVIRNAVWFNFNGERLGSGDLTMEDLNSILQGLDQKELFVVLSENAAHWNLPSSFNPSSPGREYVMANAKWAISRYVIYKVDDGHPNQWTQIQGRDAFLANRQYFYDDVGYDPNVKTSVNTIQASSPTAKKLSNFYYKLETWECPDGRIFAVGTEDQIKEATKDWIHDNSWRLDFHDANIPYQHWRIPNTPQNIDVVNDMTEQHGSASADLIKILFVDFNATVNWLVDHHGCASFIADLDNTIYISGDIAGLPSGFLAFEIDE